MSSLAACLGDNRLIRFQRGDLRPVAPAVDCPSPTSAQYESHNNDQDLESDAGEHSERLRPSNGTDNRQEAFLKVGYPHRQPSLIDINAAIGLRTLLADVSVFSQNWPTCSATAFAWFIAAISSADRSRHPWMCLCWLSICTFLTGKKIPALWRAQK